METPGTKTINFKVANQIIRLRVPHSFDWKDELVNFHSFFSEPGPDQHICMEAAIEYGQCLLKLGRRSLLSDVSMAWEPFLFETSDNHYITSLKGPEKALMVSSKDFRYSTIYVSDERDVGSAIARLLMVQFGQRIVEFGGVLMHSSVVEDGRVAYAFLGKSGTGKSTHSRMWLKRFEEFRLLNDDNPLFMLDEARKHVSVFGSPWSGKTPCYRQDGFRLEGIVRLEQASKNAFQKLNGTEAFLSLIPSGTGIRWNSTIFTKMLDNLQAISSLITVGHLKCLPNTASAELCRDSLQR